MSIVGSREGNEQSRALSAQSWGLEFKSKHPCSNPGLPRMPVTLTVGEAETGGSLEIAGFLPSQENVSHYFKAVGGERERRALTPSSGLCTLPWGSVSTHTPCTQTHKDTYTHTKIDK